MFAILPSVNTHLRHGYLLNGRAKLAFTDCNDDVLNTVPSVSGWQRDDDYRWWMASSMRDVT